MNSGQKRVLLIVVGLLMAFVLFWLGINNIFLMLAALILTLVILLIIKQKRPELFAGFARESKRKAGTSFKREEGPVQKANKTYVILSESYGSGACRIVVDRPIYRIGRAEDCNYVLCGDGISRNHIRIEYSEADGACYAIDENSANGTYLNSGKMEAGISYRLMQGDCLVIDDRSFSVEYAHY